jgi:glycosyltransferase 2 family protein
MKLVGRCTEEKSGDDRGGSGKRKKRVLPRWMHRRLLMRLGVAVLVCLAAFLLYRTLSRYEPEQIVRTVTAIPTLRLLAASAFAAASYLCLTGFDALAVRYAGHVLPYRQVALTSFVSLSIGHNIGFAAMSSGTIRYRFYSALGLSAGEVAKVIIFCGVTVGLGLMILGGAALLLRPDLAQEITRLGRPILLGLGAGCLALGALYVALAAWVKKPIKLWKWSFNLPSLGLAIGQVIIGPLNFALVAGCLHQALAAVNEVAYAGVAAVYVIANVTALISHVPGGLGVIESVVTFLLPQAEVLGAVLVFRFVYFLVPLCLGGLLFAASELMRRRGGREAARGRESADAARG